MAGSLAHKVVRNTIAQIGGKAVTAAMGVVLTLLLTRYLGPAGYGVYTFVMVYVLLFGSLADWGLSLITVREGSRDLAAAREIIGNVLVIRLILAVVAMLVAVVVAAFLGYPAETRLFISVASLALVAMSLKTSFQIIFNVKLAMQNWAYSEVVSNIVGIFLTGYLIWKQAPLAWFIFTFPVAPFFSAAAAAILGYRLLPLRLNLITPTTKYLLWEALPMGSILVLFTIYNRVDTLILAHFKSSVDVGYYGLAYRIFEVLVLGAAYFANSVLPILSELAVSDRRRMGEVFRKSFVILAFMGIAAATFSFSLAPLVPYVFGVKFAGSVVAVQVLSLALITSYFNHINGYTIIALGKQWWSLIIAVVALVVNVGLNWIFIPLFSYPAAAFITFVTEGVIVVMSLIVIRREIGVLPRLSDVFVVAREIMEKKGQIF